MTSSSAPTVSIIVSTLGRASQLHDALHGISGISYPNFEVIVVNGPSRDETSSVLDMWATRVKLLHCPTANLSTSRNIGVAAAAGEIIALLDDDATPHPAWLARLVTHYADPRVGAVGGYTVDNTGTRFQVRKTVCDRYGNAYAVSEMFDERPLNRVGTPFFPSLLGTNCSVRADVLQQIGGFDETFAYFLDETDVCLRVVDAGYAVLYEPTALVYHQFAASHTRDARRVPRSRYPAAVSKAYFILRHGAPRNLTRAAAEIERYRRGLYDDNAQLEARRDIINAHRLALDRDVTEGIREGADRARRRGDREGGDLCRSAYMSQGFKQFPPAAGLRIAMVCRAFGRENSGIARWTETVSSEMARRGHALHILLEAAEGEKERVSQADGIWIHSLHPDVTGPAALIDLDLPADIAAWNRRVWQEAQALKSFGLEVLSFPNWDLEGVAVLDDPSLLVAMSLHTSYALARPHKPEWQARPLFDHFMVRRMVAAEGRALRTAPLLLANTRAVVNDLEVAHGLTLDPSRVVIVPHGTHDGLMQPWLTRPPGSLRVLFVGRYERRKGFDLAAAAALMLLDAMPDARVTFVGGDVDASALALLAEADAEAVLTDSRIEVLGVLSRSALMEAYAACDVVLMPSRYESFGLVAIEAMAAGRPVVGIAAGGLAEVVTHGIDGMLVSDGPRASNDLAATLIAVDRGGLLQALAHGARQSFEARFTTHLMVDQIEAAFREAIKARTNS